MLCDLQLGGYTIRLDERENHHSLVWPLEQFKPFLASLSRAPDIDLTVRVVKRLPELLHGILLFDACHGLWKLFEAADGYVLESADTQRLEPLVRGMIAEDFSHVEVWIHEHHSQMGDGWMPMQIINPLVEVCVVTKLAREGGLLIHAAGVLTEAGTWVFTGSSGAGKSTLSDFFAARGACVLSDERMIIRQAEDGFAVYGTPWVGTSHHAKNRTGPLTGLYCIRHGIGSHRMSRMSPRAFSQFVLQQCFLPHWDRDAMDRTLAFLSELVDRVDCFDLAFVNQPDIVDYLEGQRHGHVVTLS